MAVPKRKTSRSRRGMRRAHQHLEVSSFSVCPRCKSAKLPHRVCPSCGYYKSKQVLEKESS
ncbi:MAG: 50S ribosomal protein L32 [Thermodesulfobacterium commune]|uniref:Large ribosomal subunit protein bL32 n=1 Tax=Thermodesulfobacterium commune TaxID=1741 RepID=A0A101FJW5_9BACT|nr:MAG: 50S ribosomal protein L32 [Thermodesulfobacterium commune]HAA83351.1 50S ribosomal protein L32 [Thermodesulfobacterium commune]HCE80187.1 50S ribosomal protein L32 [Thermodesulfobacterium commune]